MSWIHHRRELHWYSKEVVAKEFSKFREQVRGGRFICSQGNVQDKQDKDGRWWYFLVLQDRQQFAVIDHCPLPLAVQEQHDVVVPFGTDHVMAFGFSAYRVRWYNQQQDGGCVSPHQIYMPDVRISGDVIREAGLDSVTRPGDMFMVTFDRTRTRPNAVMLFLSILFVGPPRCTLLV